jgi:SAM-dependent MidA family methyltransferase
MEQALYHPEYGYYSTPRKRIGRGGDYITNVSTGMVYGQILAAQLFEMRDALDEPKPFTVVEQGAEDGKLAFDILTAMHSAEPAFAFRYIIVEPIAAKKREQHNRLIGRFSGTVRWVTNMADLEAINGVFISNELLDAMPVHLLRYRESCWHELYVTLSAERFVFVDSDLLSPALAEAASRLPTPVRIPYRTEINLNAAAWINQVARRLERGFVFLVDYGYSREEYYKAERIEGTLACYSRHRRFFNPLENPGQMDITAHVDFTSLAESAERAKLHVTGFADQHHFMVGATESYLLTIEKEICASGLGSRHQRFLRQLKTLMHPANMGMAFKYLLFSTHPRLEPPSGFKYAQEPRRILGLSP